MLNAKCSKIEVSMKLLFPFSLSKVLCGLSKISFSVYTFLLILLMFLVLTIILHQSRLILVILVEYVLVL